MACTVDEANTLVNVFVTTPSNYKEVLSVCKGERLYDAIEVDEGEDVCIVNPLTGEPHIVDPDYVVHADITVWIFVAGEEEEEEEDDGEDGPKALGGEEEEEEEDQKASSPRNDLLHK